MYFLNLSGHRVAWEPEIRQCDFRRGQVHASPLKAAKSC